MDKKQYNGLDLLKFAMAILVAARHVIQVYYPPESKWNVVIVAWLSNLAVPVFFLISGFLLFRKLEEPCSVSKRKAGWTAVKRYSLRMLRIYLIWSAIYLPLDYLLWRISGQSAAQGVLTYIQRLIFSSPALQLWYLPACAVACLLIWFCWSRGIRLWQLLLLTGALFCVGCVCDNWYFNQRLPLTLRNLLNLYFRYFLTVRNGIFYGSFFVALGLWLSRRRRKLPSFWPFAAGSVVSAALMLAEVIHCHGVNMIFLSAPTAFCLFGAAVNLEGKPRKLYPRLRSVSQWVYLAHLYFIHFYNWTKFLNPLPATKKGITISILGSLLLFSWCMTLLSEHKPFAWLKKIT